MRIRLTTRWWMVVIALVAVSLSAAQWRSHCLRSAAWHEMMARRCDWEANGIALEVAGGFLTKPPFERQAALLREGSYHDALADKYRRAAWRPWLPLEVDPPEPK
jgi:hypothetical protein